MALLSASVVAEQAALVEEATGFVAEQRFHLRKAIDQHDLELALRCGQRLANELRSTLLAPENYYQLYILVYWELQYLAAFVAQTEVHGLSLSEVYELVQYEGNVLPRLYLLVTVAAVYMQSSAASIVDEILSDIMSLISAVQHPMRGLFLRYYLLQMTKDTLVRRLSVEAVLRFLLVNFHESAKLWVRLRQQAVSTTVVQGHVKQVEPPTAASSFFAMPPVVDKAWHLDHSTRSLRLLVGAHLMNIARLPLMTIDLHLQVVLPEALQQSTSCQDPAGKAYLLDCFIQAFPDSYLVFTLDRVLAACAEVHQVVDLKPLLQRVMRRLTRYLKDSPGAAPPGVESFTLFHDHLRDLHQRPRSTAAPLASLLELQLELLMSALALHPGEADRVHLVLRGAVDLLEQNGGADLDVKSIESIVNLLAAPLTQAQIMPAVLAMPHHASLIGELDNASQREAAVAMLSALLEGNVTFGDSDTLQRLFVLIDHLIHDESGGEDKFQEFDLVRFTVEQDKVARLVHQVRHPEASKVFEMLVVVRRYLNEGGKHRICHTLPAVVVSALRLVMPLIEQQRNSTSTSPPTVSVDELFEFAHETCTALGSLQPEECLPLWIMGASTSNRADQALGGLGSLGSTCSRFVERALACLETDIWDQKVQFRGLSLVVGTLCQITCLQADVYELLAERTLRFGARLKTKRLQSKAHCICSNLFWSPRFHSARRVLVCLRSALHLADDAIHNDPLDIGLFVDVFDQAVHLFEAGNEEITDSFLLGLFSVCKHHLQYIGGRAPLEARRALRAAAKHIQSKAADSRYSKLQADASDASLQTLDVD